jgi:hypothetical protein
LVRKGSQNQRGCRSFIKRGIFEVQFGIDRRVNALAKIR